MHVPAVADVPEIVEVPVAEQDHSLAGSLDWGAIASSLDYRPPPPQPQQPPPPPQQQQQQQQVTQAQTQSHPP